MHIPQKLVPCVKARERFRLSDMHVQMARELGLNPRKLGQLANHDQEPWKLPLPAYIEHLHEKHFGRAKPETVRSIEEIVQRPAAKKRARREARHARSNPTGGPERAG